VTDTDTCNERYADKLETEVSEHDWSRDV